MGDGDNYIQLQLDGYMAKPYTIKVAALLNSAFEDILFLDADNVVVRDPTYLFDSPEYLDTGAMFFRTLGAWLVYASLRMPPCTDTPLFHNSLHS